MAMLQQQRLPLSAESPVSPAPPPAQSDILREEKAFSFGGGLVRYRTAAILSVVLIGGMFILPAAVRAAFLPSLERGLPNPVPGYEQILLGVAVFFLRWRFLLALPIVVVLFAVAAFTDARTPARR